MRGVGAAVAAAVTATVLTGCGGGAGGDTADEAGEGTPRTSASSASPSPSWDGGRRRTPTRVEADFRMAAEAGGFPRPVFDTIHYPELPHACRLMAWLPTKTPPDPADVEKAAAVLRKRGWNVDAFGSEDGMSAWGVDRRPWAGTINSGFFRKEDLAAKLPADRKDEVDDFTGLVFDQISNTCGEPLPPPGSTPSF
ncbi:hypothetical protein ACL02U_02325 [Streptomyces sp. MS06]|uniref:hypothetical protein n=1 Tax=Streptomyces sp. MS06 TaxID=3385974 RepID=UPI0039A050FE